MGDCAHIGYHSNLRSNMRSVKRQPAAETADLRRRLTFVLKSRPELSAEALAEEARVSPNSLRALLSGETRESREHVRDRLMAYLAQQVAAPAPQDESAAPRNISGSSAYIRLSGATGPAFDSEDHRRGYLQKTLEDAARAIREAQDALRAPLREPVSDADVDELAELLDPPAGGPGSRRTRPAR